MQTIQSRGARVSFVLPLAVLLAALLAAAAEAKPGGHNKAPRAVAEASPRRGFAPLTVTLDGSASTDDGTIVSYQWDLGDGLAGSGATVQHRYRRAGTYDAVLTVTDDGGETDTRSVRVTVDAPALPTAVIQASPLSGDASLTVHFDGTASTAGKGANLTTAIWDFGDNSPQVTGLTATHTYQYFNWPGTYTASLTLINDQGGAAAADVVITATKGPGTPNRPPSVIIANTGGTGATPFTVGFSAWPTDLDADAIVYYRWIIESDRTEPQVLEGEQLGGFAQTFFVAATYRVRVTVRDERGAWSEPAELLVIVEPGFDFPPTATIEAGATSGQAPFTTTFTARTEDFDLDPIAFYSWTVETAAGVPIALVEGALTSSFTYTFSQPGTYEVRLRVQDARGAWSEIPAEVTVTVTPDPAINHPPTVAIDASATGGTAPLHVILSAAAQDPDGDEIVYYRWLITGDPIEPAVIEGPQSSGFLFTFADHGTYQVRLIVLDARGAWSEVALLNLTVAPGPNDAPLAFVSP